MTAAAAPVAAPRTCKVIAVHPLLFALSPVLSLYVTNHAEVPLADIVRPAAIIIGSATLLWVILYAALRRDIYRSAAICSAIVFWLLAFGRVTEQSDSFLFDLVVISLPNAQALHAANIAAPRVLAVVWLLLLLLTVSPFVGALRRRFRDLSGLTSALNIAGAVLVVVPLASIVLMATASHNSPISASAPADDAILGGSRNADDPRRQINGQSPSPSAPDVYFIVLDAYGRQDELKRFYGFDNSPFTDALRHRGFAIVPKARANYDQTALCLSAALDMGYLPSSNAPTASISADFDDAGVNHAVNQSVVADVFRHHGYRIITVTCEDWLVTKLSPDLNLNGLQVDSESTTPFEELIENLTPLAMVPRAQESQYDAHRNQLDSGWQSLAYAAQYQPERKFVFAHILAPHPPFVFGPNGEHIQPTTAGRIPFSLADASDYLRSESHQTYHDGYLGQLRYVNTRTLAAIDAIRAASKTPPIIIVIGDHGSRQFLDWNSLQHTELREVFSNLQAYYLPDRTAASVYGTDASPINAFRLLFNHQFGAHYKRLLDRSYYSTKNEPFAYTDVTDRATL